MSLRILPSMQRRCLSGSCLQKRLVLSQPAHKLFQTTPSSRNSSSKSRPRFLTTEATSRPAPTTVQPWQNTSSSSSSSDTATSRRHRIKAPLTPTSPTPPPKTHSLSINAPLSFPPSKLSSTNPTKLRSTIRFQYFPECSYLVRRCFPNAVRAVAFDWRHSAAKPEWSLLAANEKGSLQLLRRTLGDEEAREWIGRQWGVVRVEREIGVDNDCGVRVVLEEGDEEVVGDNDGVGNEAGLAILEVRVLTLLES